MTCVQAVLLAAVFAAVACVGFGSFLNPAQRAPSAFHGQDINSAGRFLRPLQPHQEKHLSSVELEARSRGTRFYLIPPRNTDICITGHRTDKHSCFCCGTWEGKGSAKFCQPHWTLDCPESLKRFRGKKVY